MTQPDRTTTTKWRNLRKRFLKQAQANGITHCPLCGITLDYTRTRRPNSAEPDHIIPHANGGQDTIQNLRSICRRCNQTLGGKLGRTKQTGTQKQNVPNINF